MKKQLLRLTFLVATIAVIFTACQKEFIDKEAELLQNIEESSKLITYDQAQVIEGQYIIVFKEDAVANDRASITKSNYSAKQEEMKAFASGLFKERNVAPREIPHAYVKTIKGVSMKLTDQEVQELRKDKKIAYIEQDQMFHVTMGGPPGGGGGGDPSQTTPYGVTRVGGAIDGSGAGKAWIIDSGIDLDHNDLNVDVANSISFLTKGGPSASNPDDQNGHGTHVAGTVGAIDNAIGAIGVAAGAQVVAVRVLDKSGSGSNSGVIAGVDYVAANASSGDAANMSLGGGVSTALDNAVIAASSSCPFALAAGNESQHANNSSPARANGSNIYTVSSMTSSDTWSSFSNFGNPPVDYCAPGSGVYSTYKGGGYATLSGTSMASPHVCGILLIGGISSDGNVIGDPDGNADPIAHH
ncbi:MAG: subtilisin family serine protease [Saprospiraceae bacterium]|jgi:subtilisin family serine protease